MANNAILWQAAPVSRATALSTELASLANAAYSTVGSAFDNTTNLDQYACFEVICTSTVTVGASAYCQVYVVQSADGTNYEDPPASTNPGTHMLSATIALQNTTALKRAISPWVRIPPGKFKLVFYNASGVALPATGNSVIVYTSNDEVQ